MAESTKSPGPVGTVNTYDQLMRARAAGLPDVAIVRSMSPSSSRSTPYTCTGWAIWRPGIRLRNNCSWYEKEDHLPFKFWDYPDNGVPRGFTARIAAMTSAETKYGVEKWTRNRMGDYVDARVNKQFPLRDSK